MIQIMIESFDNMENRTPASVQQEMFENRVIGLKWLKTFHRGSYIGWDNRIYPIYSIAEVIFSEGRIEPEGEVLRGNRISFGSDFKIEYIQIPIKAVTKYKFQILKLYDKLTEKKGECEENLKKIYENDSHRTQTFDIWKNFWRVNNKDSEYCVVNNHLKRLNDAWGSILKRYVRNNFEIPKDDIIFENILAGVS